VLTTDVHIADFVEAGTVRRVHRSPFLKKRLMSTVFDEVEGRFFGAAASAV
jgi:hypothetical protein